MKEKVKVVKLILNHKCNGKIYLFGASETGKHVLKKISEYNADDMVEAFVDNNKKLQGKVLNNKLVIDKAKLQKILKPDDIVLITSNKFLAISEELKKLKIFNYLRCDELFIDYCYNYSEDGMKNLQPWEKAILWLENAMIDGEGIRATSSHYHAYPEVTGYIVPTLIDYGYYNIAHRAINWLLTLQNSNGGFTGIKGTNDQETEYVFDSGQILRGFLAMKDDKELKEKIQYAIDNVCNYLIDSMIDEGKGGYIKQYSEDDPFIAEPILIYTLAPLKKAAEYRKRDDWKKAADNCLQYYINHKDFLNRKTLTHFLAYQIEALIELGKPEYIEDSMKYFEDIYIERGYIPGIEGAEWTCSTGNAQIAICAYLTGKNNLANKLMDDLEKLQMDTGGFMGSYGKGAEYFPTSEISWANKYFLDANRLRIQEWFNDNVDSFPVDINESNEEFKKIIEYIKDNMDIAEIGCGKGRFLKLLNSKFENLSLTGVDISKKMLEELPFCVKGIEGTLEHIPLETNAYDVVLCIEAIEHSINIPVAVKELVRITKEGGRVIIIDKNVKHWGRLKCPSWERWLDRDAMNSELKQYCTQVKCETIDLYHQSGDDMFLLWTGIKR